MHQCRPFLNDPNPRVAVTVDPSLVPGLDHRFGHPALDAWSVRTQALSLHWVAPVSPPHARMAGRNDDQGRSALELLLALRAICGPGFEGGSHLRDHLDGLSDDRLRLRDFVQTARDALDQAAELLFREPPCMFLLAAGQAAITWG